MKPVRLPASATNPLPRWAVLALCLLYILPGMIRRDPWKWDDVTGFGIMWTMAHGTPHDWLWPNIAGLPAPEEGPLAFWFGAIFIRFFGGLLGDALAARLSIIGFFVIGALSVWYATYLLGRRQEAQPLRLAFGGQPEPKDFGRTLADGALLIYLGSLGLLLRSHETTAQALEVSLVAFAIYASVRLLESHSTRAALLFGATLGLCILTRGWPVPLAVWIGVGTVAALRRSPALWKLVWITLPLAFALGALWPLLTHFYLPANDSPTLAWLRWNRRQISWPSWSTLAYMLKYGIWFAWPAWPFAGWALYAWRKQASALHIMLPVGVFSALAVLSLLNPHHEEAQLLPLLPVLAILAAFGLSTMKRGAINAVDWFSVLTLSLCAAFIWLGWIAKQTGWPAQIAKNAFRLAPGFKPEFNLTAFLIAAAATIGWLAVVHWRLSRRPPVLWRAVVLSSGGVILCWLLLMTLWLPWLNYGKSYAGVAEQIASHMPPSIDCVATNVGPAQRASFAYFGKVNFAEFDEKDCNALLIQGRDEKEATRMLRRHAGIWQLAWEGHRPSDRDELFRLYRRVSR